MPVGLKVSDGGSIARFVDRLEKFDKEVSKDLKKEMRQGAGIVQSEAKNRIMGYPLSNWGQWTDSGLMPRSTAGRDLGFIPSWAKSGVKVKTRRYRKRGVVQAFSYDVVQNFPGGAIYEIAGAQKRGGQLGGGATFFQNLKNKGHGDGPYPRTLYPAYYAGIKKARGAMTEAIKRAERRVGL